jgi:hypothetical protein
MKRLDAYPDLDENEKGISPWFRLGLVGTYHRGILVAHGWGTLTKDEDAWRYTDYKAGERGDLRSDRAPRVQSYFYNAAIRSSQRSANCSHACQSGPNYRHRSPVFFEVIT